MYDLCGVSQRAFDLIVSEEDGDQAYYTRHYQHWDWPEGASGPTVGVGCDCGQMNASTIRANWTGIVDDATVDKLTAAAGITGGAASGFVARHRDEVTITWDQAQEEFARRELPQWVAIVRKNLANCDLLSGDSFGALVSLAYNRGASFHMPGSRYAEMRAIAMHMGLKDFSAIPGDFLTMRRLWPRGGDLWLRRGHEAALFTAGLGATASMTLPAAVPTPVVQPAPAGAAPTAIVTKDDIRWLQAELNRRGARPLLDVDGSYGSGTRKAVAALQTAHGLDVDGFAGPKTLDLIKGLA